MKDKVGYYQLVPAATWEVLTDEINQAIAEGCEPFGSPFVSDGVFYQAIIEKTITQRQ